MKSSNLILVLAALFIIQSCSIADLRTTQMEKAPLSTTDEQKGRDLLTQAWKAQGMDQLQTKENYEVVATDHWKGILGGIGKLWPTRTAQLNLKYAVGTFDSQVSYEGKKGFTAGLQSWRYYELDKNGNVMFKDKADKRVKFGLAAYQYFFELPDRLLNAPIVYYAGEETFKDKNYQLVFVSWEKVEPHKEHDQYLLYINPESKMIEMAEYTVRENYLPASGFLHGSIIFDDFRTVEGISIPFKQSIFVNSPKEKEKKYIHQFNLDSFKFDQFDTKMLYPNKNLEKLGDEKISR